MFVLKTKKVVFLLLVCTIRTPRWFRAAASGTILTIDYCDDGTTFTNVITTTASAYIGAGSTQYMLGFNVGAGGMYIDDVTYDSTLSVETVSFGANELKVFPSIVSDYLNIETSISEKLKIAVFNLQGKLLKVSASEKIDMQEFAAGLYILNVTGGNKVANLKIIKN